MMKNAPAKIARFRSPKVITMLATWLLLCSLVLALPALAAPPCGSELENNGYGVELAYSTASQPAYSEKLPNGATVLLKQSSASPTVSINIFVKAGGFEETSENMGISHFYEHLFFRGTPSLNGYQFKRAIEALGGSTNAMTGRDFTHYFINMPSKNVVEGLKLLADALVNANMDDESIDQERKAVLEEYRIGNETPTRLMAERLADMAYEEHPYGRPVIGTESNIRKFNRQDFIKFRDSFITPERIFIIVTGDFSSNEILPVIRQSFGTFTRGSNRPLVRPRRVKIPQGEVKAVDNVPMSASFMVLGYVGPSVKDRPDLYRVDVMSFLMGVGRGSMINQQIVDKKVAMDGGVEFLTQRFPGLITMYAIGAPGQEATVKKSMLDLIDEVKNGKFTDRDLRRAKNFLRSNYLLGVESNSGVADNLGFYAAIDDVSFVDSYLKEIDQVTKEEVVETAKKYLGEGHYYVEIRGEKKKAAGATGGEARPRAEEK